MVKIDKSIGINLFLNHSIAIFILVLIVSGNYLAELLPCRVQNIVRNNMFVKHLLGFMTLLFFVIITLPNIFDEYIIINAILLYIFFLIFSKTYYVFWIAIMILFSIIYIITIYRIIIKNKINDYNKEKSDKKSNTEEDETIYTHDNILLRRLKYIKRILSYTIIVLTISGFLIYLGNKKKEYGSKFDYIKFFFGNPKCLNKSPEIKSYVSEMIHAFR